MERVTNVLCGGSSHNNASIGAPEKPSRIASAKQIVTGKLITSSGSNSQQGTPQSIRKLQTSPGQHSNAINAMGGSSVGADCVNRTQKKLNTDLNSWNWIVKSNICTMEQLLQDERFLNKFFQYFTPYERRTLAQVCTRWRDTLYRSPKFWSGILPTIQCRELRMMSNQDRVKLYNSLVRRGFHAICLLGATDEDAIDIVHSFPLASKHIHSLSLRCASVSDRGLEALLDHLQVSSFFKKKVWPTPTHLFVCLKECEKCDARYFSTLLLFCTPSYWDECSERLFLSVESVWSVARALFTVEIILSVCQATRHIAS